jgi:hypothetical protein
MPLQRWATTSAGSDPAGRELKRLENVLGRTPTYGAARLVTATTTITDSDDLLLVDTTSGAVTVNLPVAGTVLGRRFTVKKTNAGANNVTLDGSGSETIDGAATLAWNTQWQAYTVQAVILTAPATAGWVIV